MDERILYPLLLEDNSLKKISFDKAWAVIADKVLSVNPCQTVCFASGQCSNEELFLIQRLMKEGIRSYEIASFEYLQRSNDFCFDKNDIVPFAEMTGASRFFCFGFNQQTRAYPFEAVHAIIDCCKDIPVHYMDEEYDIRNYRAFFRAINYYIVKNNYCKGIYINGLGKNYKQYKKKLLTEDLSTLLKQISFSFMQFSALCDLILQEKNPIYLFRESAFDLSAIHELENLCMLTDVQSKQSSGFLGIKADINSQGLFDMGIFPDLTVGGEKDETQTKGIEHVYSNLLNHKYRCALIFGNDAVTSRDAAIDRAIRDIPFKVVQCSTMTETAKEAALILPASLPCETDGIYTDCTHRPHPHKHDTTLAIEYNNLQQISDLSRQFGLPALDTPSNIFLSYISYFKAGCKSDRRHFFRE